MVIECLKHMAFFLQEILKIVHLYARHLTFSSCTLEQKFNTETGIKISGLPTWIGPK